jgi:hypothetical protein
MWSEASCVRFVSRTKDTNILITSSPFPSLARLTTGRHTTTPPRPSSMYLESEVLPGESISTHTCADAVWAFYFGMVAGRQLSNDVTQKLRSIY